MNKPWQSEECPTSGPAGHPCVDADEVLTCTYSTSQPNARRVRLCFRFDGHLHVCEIGPGSMQTTIKLSNTTSQKLCAHHFSCSFLLRPFPTPETLTSPGGHGVDGVPDIQHLARFFRITSVWSITHKLIKRETPKKAIPVWRACGDDPAGLFRHSTQAFSVLGRMDLVAAAAWGGEQGKRRD